MNFNSLKELRARIEPVINTKLKELRSNNYLITTSNDIWLYLKDKWMQACDLTLYDITHDIINLNNEEIENYAFERRNHE